MTPEEEDLSFVDRIQRWLLQYHTLSVQCRAAVAYCSSLSVSVPAVLPRAHLQIKGIVAVACADTGATSWLQLHAHIQARRAGCSCMRGELVAVACATSWLQLHAKAAPCFLAMLKTKGFIEPKGSKRDF